MSVLCSNTELTKSTAMANPTSRDDVSFPPSNVQAVQGTWRQEGWKYFLTHDPSDRLVTASQKYFFGPFFFFFFFVLTFGCLLRKSQMQDSPTSIFGIFSRADVLSTYLTIHLACNYGICLVALACEDHYNTVMSGCCLAGTECPPG